MLNFNILYNNLLHYHTIEYKLGGHLIINVILYIFYPCMKSVSIFLSQSKSLSVNTLNEVTFSMMFMFNLVMLSILHNTIIIATYINVSMLVSILSTISSIYGPAIMRLFQEWPQQDTIFVQTKDMHILHISFLYINEDNHL